MEPKLPLPWVFMVLFQYKCVWEPSVHFLCCATCYWAWVTLLASYTALSMRVLQFLEARLNDLSTRRLAVNQGHVQTRTSKNHWAVLFSCPSHNQYWASNFGLESSLYLDIYGFLLVILSFDLSSVWMAQEELSGFSHDTEMAATGTRSALEG